EGRDAPRAALEIFDLGFFDAGQAADARPDDGADAVGIFFGDFDAGIPPGLHPGRHAIMDEDIHLLGFLGRHVLRNVAILDFARYLGIERRWVESGDSPYSRPPIYDLVPCAVNILAHWRDDTQTGNDDTSFHG